MKKIILLLTLVLGFSVLAFADEEAPKNVKLLSQSCTQICVFLTVLDLDTNEIVILQYGPPSFGLIAKLVNVIHTKMKADPAKSVPVSGVDAPFKDDRS